MENIRPRTKSRKIDAQIQRLKENAKDLGLDPNLIEVALKSQVLGETVTLKARQCSRLWKTSYIR